MKQVQVIPGLSADTYQRHWLHSQDAVWVEKNCYGDLWIELLHALKLEPLAMLPFTLAVDFEGDQWTFFKPSLDELHLLYGIDVQELTIWRPLLEHAIEHLGAGKLISVETDAFWLPDTAGTDYRSKHSKTTILLSELDCESRKLGYFHNAGYFELTGEDFEQVFQLGEMSTVTPLPLFAELVRIDRVVRPPPEELAAKSWGLLQKHLNRRPVSNPFMRFGARFASDLPQLQTRGLPYYHAWAFASIRQAGAAFDLAAANLHWLAEFHHPELNEAACHFETIAQLNKALILKGARSVNSGRAFDATPIMEEMALSWEKGMKLLSK